MWGWEHTIARSSKFAVIYEDEKCTDRSVSSEHKLHIFGIYLELIVRLGEHSTLFHEHRLQVSSAIRRKTKKYAMRTTMQAPDIQFDFHCAMW